MDDGNGVNPHPIAHQLRMAQKLYELEALANGPVTYGHVENVPWQLEEVFLDSVLAWERAPWTTPFEMLRRRGVPLPPPDALADSVLRTVLWRVIRALADCRIFLHSTNHLSDRELYLWLWNNGLREETKDLSNATDGATHLDVLGGASQTEIEIWLRYYADAVERRLWWEQWPGVRMPPMQRAPFDRDRFLPRPPDPGA